MHSTQELPAVLRRLTTEEFADALRLKAQSIRAALCRQGHYAGVRPSKLPNGRLLWPADAVARLISGEGV